MLPDQIHKRNEDYTLFLLHRNTTNGEFQYLFNKVHVKTIHIIYIRLLIIVKR